MNKTKRIIAMLLAGIMLLGLFGCVKLNRLIGCFNRPGEEKPQTTEAPAATAEAQATEKPAEAPTEEPVDPEKVKAAEAAFWALDEELFLYNATTDITALDQYCVNPANFGIDESTVPVTLGNFTEEANNEWVAKCKEWREKLDAIDRRLLSDQLQFAYDTYCRYFDMEIESADWFYC